MLRSRSQAYCVNGTRVVASTKTDILQLTAPVAANGLRYLLDAVVTG